MLSRASFRTEACPPRSARQTWRAALIPAALAAAGSLWSWAASAQTTDGPIRLGLGGYFSFYGVYLDQSNDPGEPGAFRQNFDLKREAEIFFTGQTTLSNGLRIGVDVQLEAESCSDQIDESYIWFQGSWGRLNLGSENSAAYLLSPDVPLVDGNFDGIDPTYRLWNGFVGDPRAPPTGGASPIDTSVTIITSDSEKLTYLSPRIAGLRAGFSYTPDNSEETSAGSIKGSVGATGGMNLNNNAGEWGNVVELGLNYDDKIGLLDVILGAGYGYGFLESGDALGTFKNRQTWHLGGQLGFGGIKFGGIYFYDDNGLVTRGTQRNWQIGLSYAIGPWAVGVSYLDATRSRASLAGAPLPDETLKRVLVGARYGFARGVDFRGSIHYYDYDAGAPDTNTAWGAVFGTVLTF